MLNSTDRILFDITPKLFITHRK